MTTSHEKAPRYFPAAYAQECRLKFYRNPANHTSGFCDGCLTRNIPGPMFYCQSCDNYGLCLECFRHRKEFHDPMHTFELSVNASERDSKHVGIVCGGCKQADFTGPRYNCQQCLDSFDLCQQCIPNAASLHSRKHTFVAIGTSDISTVHDSVTCDGCQTKPVIGQYYHCLFCSNFDLCARCYLTNTVSKEKIHDDTHKFYLRGKDASSSPSNDIGKRADLAIARIRAKHGPEYNGNAVDAETGLSIADARVLQQQAFALAQASFQSSLQQSYAMMSLWR